MRNVSTVEAEILVQAHRRGVALVPPVSLAMDALPAEGFNYTNSSGRIFRKKEYIEAHVISPSVTWKSQMLRAERFSYVDDIAVVTGTVHDRARFGEQELDADFSSTQVYRSLQGRWLYLAGHTSVLE